MRRALSAILLLCFTLAGQPGFAGQKPVSPDIEKRISHAEELVESGKNEEAKQICESLQPAVPPDSSLAGRILNVMSKIAAAEGDYDRAIDSAVRSAEAFEKAGDDSGQAHALNNKGIAEVQQGKYLIAESDFGHALKLSQKTNDAENQVQISNNLGSSRYFHGAYSEAQADYQRAMELTGANSSASWSGYWLQITRFNQATLYQRLGRYTDALQIYREVESSSKNLSDGDRAHVYANLGTLYRRLGDPYKALDAYRAAEQLYSQQHDADGEIAVLKNSGIAYALDLQDLGRAAGIFRSALALAQKSGNKREEMQAHLYLGETLLRSNEMEPAREQFNQALAFSNQLNTDEEQWKAWFGLGKLAAATGDLEQPEEDYRKAIEVIERSRGQLQLSALRAEFFADKREVYDALLSILFKKNNTSEAFLFLEKSRARNFQDRFSARDKSGTQSLTLARAQASLPAATAMLEFWAFENQVGIIWCTGNTSKMEVVQLTREQQSKIQMAIRALPSGLAENAHLLSAILSQDLEMPPETKHLFVVPDGWITFVPFDLLYKPGSKDRLIEQYDISYLPTAALLARRDLKRSLAGPWTNELVAFGGPVTEVDEHSSSGDAAGAIPFSRQEVNDITSFARGKTQSFLQSSDLKKTFLDGTAGQAFLLHISTHAFADTDSPENSRLLFSPDSASAGSSYVYLRELNTIDLSRVDLATISACDTERGRIIRGEGVQAFSRALLSAGAHATVTTLWRVEDQATAEFMRQFYFYLLKENKPKAEALRLAKLRFLKSNSNLSDPALWAAFVLNGDGLTPVPRVLTWTEIIGSAVSIVAGLVLLALLFQHLRSRGHGDRTH